MDGKSINLNYKNVNALLESAENIVITTHRSPDGDAMGSALAMQQMLAKRGKKSQVIVPNRFPEFLAWLKGAENTVIFEEHIKEARQITNDADLIFCLDFNHLKRLEEYGMVVEKTTCPRILIDHHIDPNDCFREILSDTSASSTCELVYDFFEGLQWLENLDDDIAESLYTGLVTDTGSFRFSSTSSRTHRIVADLIDIGLKPNLVYDRIFDTNKLDRIKLLGHLLLNALDYRSEVHTAIIPFTLSDKSTYNFQKGDTEGVVNYGLSIEGSRMSIFISEESDYCKLSLRSKGELDVNKIARKYFNGGGHMNAAGGRLDLSLSATLAKIDEMISDQKEQLI